VAGGASRSLADLVFAPGVSSKDSADLDSGRGMGTVAAKDAIAGVGGTLAVESAPGHGTRFTAVVPMNRGR
jgi:two-component system chemotaxis sensor kinase CheA